MVSERSSFSFSRIFRNYDLLRAARIMNSSHVLLIYIIRNNKKMDRKK